MSALKPALVEFTKKYDRSFVLIGTAIVTLAMSYLGVGRTINSLIENSPVFQEVKSTLAEQVKFNESVLKSLERIDEKIEKRDEKFDRKFDMLISMVKQK